VNAMAKLNNKKDEYVFPCEKWFGRIGSELNKIG